MTVTVGLDAQWLFPRAAAGAGLRDFVARAEDAGLDHLGVGDHISFRDGTGFDGLINAMAVLASGSRMSVHVGVYLLPLRHPVLVARQLASIAEHAPGRLVLACGVGGEDRDEFRICGVDPATRGARADESLDALRQLLTGEPSSLDGEFFTFADARITPAPAQPIPLLIGGRSEAALTRTARVGDGWHGIWVSADRFGQAVADIAEQAEAFGRPAPRDHAMTFWCGFDHDGADGAAVVAERMSGFYGLPFEKFARYVPTGSASDVAEQIAPYLDAGCRNITLVAAGVPAEAAIDYTAEVRQALTTG